MRLFIILFLSFYLSITFGQSPKTDKGFSNKAEAKNLTKNGLKEGKWVEYFDTIPNSFVQPHYVLSFYNAGKPDGTVREYYPN